MSCIQPTTSHTRYLTMDDIRKSVGKYPKAKVIKICLVVATLFGTTLAFIGILGAVRVFQPISFKGSLALGIGGGVMTLGGFIGLVIRMCCERKIPKMTYVEAKKYSTFLKEGESLMFMDEADCLRVHYCSKIDRKVDKKGVILKSVLVKYYSDFPFYDALVNAKERSNIRAYVSLKELHRRSNLIAMK